MPILKFQATFAKLAQANAHITCTKAPYVANGALYAEFAPKLGAHLAIAVTQEQQK